jgi:hypothetical protein
MRVDNCVSSLPAVFAPITGRSRDGWSFNTMNQRRFVLEDMHPVPSRGKIFLIIHMCLHHLLNDICCPMVIAVFGVL